MISSEEVLEQLDEAARRFVFPMLDNGYVYPVDVRLVAYRAPDRWAVLIDVFGVSPKAGGVDACHNCVHAFGNCLEGEPGVSNDSMIYCVSDGPSGPAVADQYDEVLSPQAADLLVRGEVIPVTRDAARYASHGIVLRDPPAIHLSEVMRLVSAQRPGLLLATDAELRRSLAEPIPEFLSANEWRHPDLAAQELPSSTQAFASLAEALESGEVDRFDSGSPPNTHWSNWPAGGML